MVVKKITLGIVLAALALLAVSVVAVDLNPYEVVPAGVIVTVPNVAGERSPVLESITIIHYREGYAKPPWAGAGKGKPKCYAFISAGAKLIATEDFYINPASSGLSDSDVVSSISSSAEAWDSNTSAELFGSYILNATADFDSAFSPDGINEVSFGNYSTDGVIAVARLWGLFSGKPKDRYISQFDILFDTDYVWQIFPSNTTSTYMDLPNIATHEIGHSTGLADIYETNCLDVTMYGLSDYGETKKRSLEQPDITGLQQLYGA